MTRGESRQYGAPGRVGEGRKSTFKRFGFIFNLHVKISSEQGFVKAWGEIYRDRHEVYPKHLRNRFVLTARLI